MHCYSIRIGIICLSIIVSVIAVISSESATKADSSHAGHNPVSVNQSHQYKAVSGIIDPGEDCRSESPCSIRIVGPFMCDATCPVLGPIDPGKCVYIGNDYETIDEVLLNYENTGPLMYYNYLDWDCTGLLSDQCWFFNCPEEVLFEGYNDVLYAAPQPDYDCPGW